MVATPPMRLAQALCDEDAGPLLVSWTIAVAAGAAWLLAVHLAASPMIPVEVAPPISVPGTLSFEFGKATPAIPAEAAPGRADVVRHHTPASVRDVAQIFAAAIAATAVDEVTRALPGVQAIRGDVGATVGRNDKRALSAGDAPTTPGRTNLGAFDAKGSTLGQVHHAAAIARSAFHAQPLPSVIAPALDGTTVDATAFGSFVRGRVAQLQSCYELSGAADLAGVVALKITVGAGGTVRSAEIVRRSWSGPAAATAETCLLRLVRGWHVPAGSEGATITLPISFTRAG